VAEESRLDASLASGWIARALAQEGDSNSSSFDGGWIARALAQEVKGSHCCFLPDLARDNLGADWH